ACSTSRPVASSSTTSTRGRSSKEDMQPRPHPRYTWCPNEAMIPATTLLGRPRMDSRCTTVAGTANPSASGARGTPWIAALALALLAACSLPAEHARSTLRLALRADVTGFYPNRPFTNAGFTLGLNANVFEGLLRFDGPLRLVPAPAERWLNPDERTYLFELRHGLRFSDGTPVKAADVVASLEAARRHRWPNPDYFQSIASVRAVGEDSVEIGTRS